MHRILGILLAAAAVAGCSGSQVTPLVDGGPDAGPVGGCANANGAVTVSLQTVDFGLVTVKSSPVRTVIITNCTFQDVTVTASVSGPQADLFGIDKGPPFTVPAGAMVNVAVSYSPLVPSKQDLATLTLAMSEGGTVVVTLQGIALQSGLKITPNPLNFAFVQPGQSVTMPLHLTNIGNLRITVLSVTVVDPGTPAAYAIAGGSWTGGDLAPGDSQDVNVTFSPTVKTQYTGELDISSTDRTNVVPLLLTGFGGGAILSCSPLTLDFGTVAANIGSTLPVICSNTGTDVPNHPEAGVILTTMLTDNSLFSAQVDPESFNQASTQQPLAANQSVIIDTFYTPTDAGATDVGILKINSNATDGTAFPPPSVALTGMSIDEPACTYAITPTTVQFGQVSPGKTQPAGFTLSNVGPNECLVTGLGLSASTQSAFTLLSGPVISQRLSAPGSGGAYPTFLQVDVAFSPEQTGSYSGAVEFTVSDPAAPHQTVTLSGVGGNSCFSVTPNKIRFGTVGTNNGQFCTSETNQFVAVNDCAQSVTIQTATLAGSSAYVLTSGQTPQTVPVGGTSAPFVIGFQPASAGTFDADVLLQTDLQPTPFGVGLSGAAVNGNTATDFFTGHTATAQVDVLWIMDTAHSATERDTVAKNAPTFIEALNQLNLDWQVGVTSDDWCSNGITGTSENGRILPCPGCKISGQQPSVITPADANAGADLQFLMEIGANTTTQVTNACTPDKQFFNAAYQATVATADQMWNAALIRPGAYLAIISVNGDDSDDDSLTQTPQWFANQFLSIKGPDNPDLFSWSYINPSELGTQGGLQPFSALPARIGSMLSLVGGVAVDSTQNNWVSGVNGLWNTIANLNTRFPLSGTPDPTTILVYLDGPPPGQTGPGQMSGLPISQTNPNGSANWSYDATTNSLVLNLSEITLVSTDTLYVEYTLVCP